MNPDAANDDPEVNAYFKREYCVKELRWALEAGVPIQPVIRAEDKASIGDFLDLAPEDLRHLGKTDWIDLNRNDRDYWEVGVKKMFRGIDKLQKRASTPSARI